MPELSQIKEYQQRIDKVLTAHLDSLEVNDERLLKAMRYGLLIGGKRMRPYLTYITGQALKVNEDDLDAIAAALECIHAYSLIHDDLPAMDDDDLRRGQPTCHIAFDEATAILAGDALQTLAFDILSNHEFSAAIADKHIKLIQQLAKAAGYLGMCGGQAMDIAATDKRVPLETLSQVHALKTGALLTACVTMAATCCPTLSQAEAGILDDFARTAGLAYQVRDDIIDITSSEQELGKPKGSDLKHNKSTYPSLLGLEGAKEKLQQLHQQALQALASLPYNTKIMAEFADFLVYRTK